MSFSDREAVALAFLSVRHCLWRSEVGATLAKGGDGIPFFEAKSRRGQQQ